MILPVCLSLCLNAWIDSELHRFGPYEVIVANYGIMEQHSNWRQYFSGFADNGSKHKVAAWFEEAERMRFAWNCLATITYEPHGIETRCTAIRNLKMAIGLDNYLLGHMPPPVPYWRFGMK